MHQLAIVHSRGIPEQLAGCEGIVLATAFDVDDPAEIPADQLAHAVLARVCAATAEEGRGLIDGAWSDGGCEVERVDVIALGLARMTRRHRLVLRAMEPGNVSLLSTWLAYRREHEDARQQACEQLVRSATRKAWQLWR